MTETCPVFSAFMCRHRWHIDAADIYNTRHLLQSFWSRNMSAFTVFLTFCGRFGPRRSQS